ncbi:FTR1 family protein [Chitinivorax sp. B]|uniref:FTR1 family iron permease n=1 Tax=Chitinivorax sp. B TaxID=2502235 RepID=UPI0010F54F2F|nr:FTR1 family protein [Chitinivorax sp. B]
MGNALFIIWRESAEAMLVVGILYAWLKRQPDAAYGMRYLWGGVAAGIGLALILAGLMLGIMRWLPDDGLEYFQLGMISVAAILIVQMVCWMRRHGRTLKRDLERRLQRNLESANWWGLLIVVALAVGRESAETVVFLYGVGLEQHSLLYTLLIMVAGVVLAGATFWLLQRGGRWLSWRVFFTLSEILLLVLAGGLLVNAVEKMLNLGWLPPLIDPVWDSSALLDDGSTTGSFIATLTGYRAHPALLLLIAYATYWLTMWGLLRRTNR